ncbi:hypothetical protein AU476_27095 [Cupriavidus sp. UYMSc13B]|nr:hypothetical protein AU476_27095 [Cupriavidus sp. UYMSc13B]
MAIKVLRVLTKIEELLDCRYEGVEGILFETAVMLAVDDPYFDRRAFLRPGKGRWTNNQRPIDESKEPIDSAIVLAVHPSTIDLLPRQVVTLEQLFEGKKLERFPDV